MVKGRCFVKNALKTTRYVIFMAESAPRVEIIEEKWCFIGLGRLKVALEVGAPQMTG